MSSSTQPALVQIRPRQDWLDQVREAAIDPDLPIVDAHHHLWDRADLGPYMFDELLADTTAGHRVVATVYAQCRHWYKAGGPVEMRPVGEVEYVNGIAARSATGHYGPSRLCAAIIGQADMLLGDRVEPVLEAMIRVGGGRFRGIRFVTAWDGDADVRGAQSPVPGRLADAQFRRGVAVLQRLGLVYDAWAYHPQIPEVAAFASGFPDTTIVLDHCGGPIGIGPYAGRREAVFAQWRRDIRDLARQPNVVCKLGGLTMRMGGLALHERPRPPNSEELATMLRPWIETCIEAFGAERCMFQSNFPVDKGMCSYAVLWNAFKRIAAGASETEKAALFSGTAMRVYRPVLE
jgi:predicted TIM-barrel fold metal-dependent hydrolase